MKAAGYHEVVGTAQALGAAARVRREALDLSLRDLAPAAGAGIRFLSEFERGKPTAEIGKILAALHAIGLDLAVVERAQAEEAAAGGYSRLLATEFPYDWSNRRMEAASFIRAVLRAHRFNDVLKVVGHFGLDRVGQEAAALDDPALVDKVADMLARIQRGRMLARMQAHDAAA